MHKLFSSILWGMFLFSISLVHTQSDEDNPKDTGRPTSSESTSGTGLSQGEEDKKTKDSKENEDREDRMPSDFILKSPPPEESGLMEHSSQVDQTGIMAGQTKKSGVMKTAYPSEYCTKLLQTLNVLKTQRNNLISRISRLKITCSKTPANTRAACNQSITLLYTSLRKIDIEIQKLTKLKKELCKKTSKYINPPHTTKPGLQGGSKDASGISQEGLSLIGRFEGSVTDSRGRHVLYKDPVGVWTIGYGHAIWTEAEREKYKNGITEAEALALFKKDIARFETAVRDGLKVKVNQAQFDALVSLAYNIGPYGLKNSTLLKLINQGADISEIEKAWKVWNKGDGKVLQGLVNRRNKEWILYSTGKY
jgi:lysozyme